MGKGIYPLGALFTVFYSPRSYIVTSLLTLAAAIPAIYLMVLVSYSPTPPLMTSPVGEIFAVRITSAQCTFNCQNNSLL